MKERTYKCLCILYCILMSLLGIFYMLANFWKAYPAGWGILVVMLSALALVLTVLKKPVELQIPLGVISVAQLPALICWVKYNSIEFGFLGHYQSIGGLGFAVHLWMTIFGITLLLHLHSFIGRNSFHG